ncbi:hypothetical protein MMA231_00976 [Asticcacaulis sp. MM231]|uniref:phage tail sheath subtilisin-like domain-containing protein n=1 Tax=Asticcacaulis sp. MM231 TaxID=3157666 RepID=UPI0032D5AE62
MSYDIGFSKIPLNLETPGTYIELDTSQMLAVGAQGVTRILLVGQMLTGTASALTAYRVDGENEGIALFGQGSQLADMIAGFKRNDQTLELWAMGVADNAAGVVATKTITLTGPATLAGTLSMRVQHRRVQINVNVGMTATQAATALVAAINTFTDLAYTAAAAAGVVTLTAKHKGAEFNSLYVKENYDQGDVTPAGLGITIAAGTAGATNPDATAVFTALADAPFAAILHPWTDATNVAAFETAMADRADPLKMNYSEAYVAQAATYSALITALGNRNSEFGVIFCLKAGALPHAPWRVAAAILAQIAFSARNDPALPFNTLALKDILPPQEGNWFTRQERQFLLEAGGATLVVNGSGGMSIERIVTTYKRNASNLPDKGLHDLNSVLTLYYLSRSASARISSRFPRYKLASDGNTYPPGAKVVTPRMIKAELAALATSEWYEAGLIENLQTFIDAIIVERDATDRNRVNWSIRPDLINGLHVTAGLIQPIL